MKTSSITRSRIVLATLVGICVIAPEGARATVQTLDASAVKQLEYFWTPSSETWTCTDQSVHLRLHVAFDQGDDPTQIIRDRAGMDFNTSSIPDNASIQSVELELYLRDDFTYASQPVEFKRLGNKIGGVMPCYGKYIQIGNGFEYAEEMSIVAGYNTIDLGSTAAADLQAQLGANWFGVGVKMALEGINDAPDNAELSAFLSEEPHRLKVTYLINGEWKTTDGSEPKPMEGSSWGSIKGLFR